MNHCTPDPKPTNRSTLSMRKARAITKSLGYNQVILYLPTRFVERIDAIKDIRKLPNRSAVVNALITEAAIGTTDSICPPPPRDDSEPVHLLRVSLHDNHHARLLAIANIWRWKISTVFEIILENASQLPANEVQLVCPGLLSAEDAVTT